MKQRIRLKQIIARWMAARAAHPWAESFIPIGYYANRPWLLMVGEIGRWDNWRYIETRRVP